jgi:hypothetical protein
LTLSDCSIFKFMNTIPPPKNPAHQRIADLWLNLVEPADCYLQAGYKAKSRAVAAHSANRVLNRADVKRYIAAIQAAAAVVSVATVAYKRALLFEIMDVPIMRIDPDCSKETHGRLIKKFKRVTNDIGETWEIEKLCPLKAMEIDNKLAGDDQETNALTEIAKALAALAPATTLPTSKM